jgi:hypothetical protein
MADLTARFGADFSAFHDAVQKAEAELRSFDSGANQVQQSLDRMVNQFSGRKVIQDAELMTKAVEELGGASTLTEAELARVGRTMNEAVAKMDAMGLEAPANMKALAAETKGAGDQMGVLSTVTGQLGALIASAFTVQAIINFTLEAVHATAAIAKMSTQMGMTTDEVQRLQYAAAQTSVSFDSVVSASQSLAAALGDPSGNKGVIGGLRAMGISMDDFMQMGPAEQLREIAEKMQGMADSTDQATAAKAVFGNKWKEIIPLLLSDMEAIGAAATKSTEETIAWTDEMESNWATFKLDFSAVVASTVMGFGQMVTAAANWATENSAILQGWGLLRAAMADTSVESSGLAGALAQAQADLPPFGKAAADAGVDLIEMAEAEAELDKALEASFKANATKETDDLAAASKKAAEEMADWQRAFDEVEAAGRDWHETLIGIDEQLVSHIQMKLEAGVASEKLAKAYGLSDEAMKAITLSLKEQHEATKIANESTAESTRLAAELQALMVANNGSELDASVAAINKWADVYKQKLIEAGTFTTQIGEQIEAIRQEKIIGTTVEWDVLKDAAQSTLQDTATRAEATYQFMLEHSERYTQGAIQHQQDVARESQMAADVWADSFTQAGEEVGAAAEKAAGRHTAAAQQVSLTWSQAMDAVSKGQGTMSGSTNSFPATNYGVKKAYEEGRYYGPVKEGGWGGYQPDYEALGMEDPANTGPHWTGGANKPWGSKAAGGPVAGGHPYMVGEQGPELFVPNSSGAIVPNGAGGGSVVANIYVNGTGADVARIINAELTRMMRLGRKWPSV